MSTLDIAIPVPRSRFLPWKWQFWHEKRWQKNARWSGGSWAIMTILFVIVVSRWGHGLRDLIVWNFATDGVNYFVSKKKIFPDRKVTYWHSGRMSLAAAVFWFVFHKATMLLLALVFGLGVFWIRGIQGFLGILENPVAYKFNINLAFAEQETFEATTNYWRVEMCQAVAASRQVLMRIGIM